MAAVRGKQCYAGYIKAIVGGHHVDVHSSWAEPKPGVENPNITKKLLPSSGGVIADSM